MVRRNRAVHTLPDFPYGEVTCSPFHWRPPEQLPRRKWLLGRHAAHRFVSATIAAGGTGKTALALAECLSLASGKDFLKCGYLVRTRCWYVGLEDPLVEYERRIAACMTLHKLGPKDLDNDALYLDGGRSHPFVIAYGGGSGSYICEPVVEAIVDNIRSRGIGYVVVDPFVACHGVA